MRSFLALLSAVAVVSLILTAHASTGPIPLNCNRACLENLVDQYLTALVAHDPKRLPLSKDVMYTENDQVIEIGDGAWKTIEGRGNYTHIFADPEFGQVAYMGTMKEAGAPVVIKPEIACRTRPDYGSRERLLQAGWRWSQQYCGHGQALQAGGVLVQIDIGRAADVATGIDCGCRRLFHGSSEE